MAYQRFLVSLIQNKTGLGRTTVVKLLDIFYNSMLDCLASDGWLDIQGFGRFVIKRNRSFTYFHKRLKKIITTNPKPYLYTKLRKKAQMYLKKKLDELGIDWDSIVYKSLARGKNMPPKLAEWFKKKEKKEELGI